MAATSKKTTAKKTVKKSMKSSDKKRADRTGKKMPAKDIKESKVLRKKKSTPKPADKAGTKGNKTIKRKKNDISGEDLNTLEKAALSRPEDLIWPER